MRARWDSKLIHVQETGLALSITELKSEEKTKVILVKVGHVQVKQRQVNYYGRWRGLAGLAQQVAAGRLAWLYEDDIGSHCLPGTLGGGQDIANGRW